jgi:2-polyprenyl-6-hydroxyphenyl methylase/3-demethylubiquinone-9 3-methyltransferase
MSGDPGDTPTTAGNENVDAAEIAKFEALAYRWWDPNGDFKPLHDINPVRLDYILSRADVAGRRVVDVGCGGGILSEAMAQAGAEVTAIDMGESPLAVARLHAVEAGVDIDYRQTTAEALAQSHAAEFAVVTCLEMLEHVPEPASVVAACAELVEPGGHLFFSTINRNPKAYTMAVLGAEYVMGLLPRGTHDYRKFITPAELARAVRAAGLITVAITGMSYNPFSRRCALTDNVDVNYLLHARRPPVS